MLSQLKRLFSSQPMQPSSKRPVEARGERAIRFLGEQDGKPERAFVASVVPILRQRPAILRAYLARADFGPGSEPAVVLCVLGPEDESLVAEVAAIFAERFKQGVPLDILFLKELQEAQLRQVCRAFYCAG
jgi:hypothetical protein